MAFLSMDVKEGTTSVESAAPAPAGEAAVLSSAQTRGGATILEPLALAPAAKEARGSAAQGEGTMIGAPQLPSEIAVGLTTPEGVGGSKSAKRKRGRPRKYGLDGSLLMPIATSFPALGYYPLAAPHETKRSRRRQSDIRKKSHQRIAMELMGKVIAFSGGANFNIHLINVAAGEDVGAKIILFSHQVPEAIWILCANGAISNFTLRQPETSWGALTYEGRFELVSLSGSFMPIENGAPRSRYGGLSVSLAGLGGQIFGGGVAGLLIAASPVQVYVGSFKPSCQMEQKSKKQRPESASTSIPPTTVSNPPINAHGVGHVLRASTVPNAKKENSDFRGEIWALPQTELPDINASSTMDSVI